MNSKEITQAVKRYVATGFSSVGIEYVIKGQPVGIQQKFWNLVRKEQEKNVSI